MGGQGFIPEDGKGGIVEGTKEAREGREEHAYEEIPPAGGAAPRGGMQGVKERGAAPTQTLERPGTTPEATPGTGGGLGKTESPATPEGGRVKEPNLREDPNIKSSR